MEPSDVGPASLPRPVGAVLDSSWGAALLLGALSVALLLQGAYYPSAQLLVAVLLAAAVLALAGSGVLSGVFSSGGSRSVLVPAAGLAGWAAVDAVLHARSPAAVGYLALLAGMLVVRRLCAGLDAAARELVLTGLLGCGVLLALLGWLGLALHLTRWTWQGQGLWRASSTLTYPNATAVLLAMLALICLARLADPPRSLPLALGVTVLLAGLAATLSRAGLLALAAGALVLAVARGPATLLRTGWGPVLGAVVAALGLVPAMTASGPRPVPAAVALAAGLGISAVSTPTVRWRRNTAGVPAVRWRRGPAAGLAALAAGALAAGALAATALAGGVPGWAGLAAITRVRLTVADPERAASFSAALRVFGDHPLTGAGPGLSTLTWPSATGTSVYRYAHNEYLQVLAELGVVGGALLAALLASVLGRLWRSRRAGVGAGVLAAVTALVVHAGFDFVWHIPAVPLVAAALVGLASPEPPVSNTRPGEIPRKEYR